MGGVILRTFDWRPRRRWERRLGIRPGGLAHLVFEGTVARRATVGQATIEDVWQEIGDRYGLTASERSALAADFFSGDGFDQDLLSAIQALRPRLRTCLISNAWPGTRELLASASAADVFDLLVISAEIGLAKPGPAIYQRALEGLRVGAEAAVFIDDMPANLEAAKSLGMRTVLFNGTRRTIAAVRRAVDST